MVLYGLVDLGMNSWDFYLGFGYKKFQTTNTSVVELFWVNSMLVLRNGCKKVNVLPFLRKLNFLGFYRRCKESG